MIIIDRNMIIVMYDVVDALFKYSTISYVTSVSRATGSVYLEYQSCVPDYMHKCSSRRKTA